MLRGKRQSLFVGSDAFSPQHWECFVCCAVIVAKASRLLVVAFLYSPGAMVYVFF